MRNFQPNSKSLVAAIGAIIFLIASSSAVSTISDSGYYTLINGEWAGVSYPSWTFVDRDNFPQQESLCGLNGIADLVVEEIAASPSPPKLVWGNTPINIKIKNRGDDAAGTTKAMAFADNGQKFSLIVPPIDCGASATVQFYFMFPDGEPHYFHVAVDYDKSIDEDVFGERNNDGYETITAIGPDFYATRDDATFTDLANGQMILDLTIHNIGNDNADFPDGMQISAADIIGIEYEPDQNMSEVVSMGKWATMLFDSSMPSGSSQKFSFKAQAKPPLSAVGNNFKIVAVLNPSGYFMEENFMDNLVENIVYYGPDFVPLASESGIIGKFSGINQTDTSYYNIDFNAGRLAKGNAYFVGCEKISIDFGDGKTESYQYCSSNNNPVKPDNVFTPASEHAYKAGTYSIKIEVDSASKAVEMNEKNNVFIKTITIDDRLSVGDLV